MLHSRKHVHGLQSLRLTADIGQRKRQGKKRFRQLSHPVRPDTQISSHFEAALHSPPLCCPSKDGLDQNFLFGFENSAIVHIGF